jgi:hypothetical protein
VLLDPERPVVIWLIDELIEFAKALAAELGEASGMSVFGSNGSWLCAAAAASAGERALVTGFADEPSAAAFTFCAALGVVPVPDDDVNVWLILISWSNWFNEIIWPTMAVESTGAVGSWFCSSVDKRFKKVVSNPEPDVAIDEVPLDEPVLGVALGPAALAIPLVAAGLRLFMIDGMVKLAETLCDILPPWSFLDLDPDVQAFINPAITWENNFRTLHCLGA